MKKLLSTALVIFTMQTVSAQVIFSEDCSNLNLGNLDGGWKFNGNADFKVVNSQINQLGKSIKITGPSTPAMRNAPNISAKRKINWGSRAKGNDIVEFKFTAKVVSTSPNSFNSLTIGLESDLGTTGVCVSFSKESKINTLFYLYGTENNSVQYYSINPNTATPEGEVGYYIINYDLSETKIRIRRTNENGSITYADNTYKSGPNNPNPTAIFINVSTGGGVVPPSIFNPGPKNSASTTFLIDNISLSAVSSLSNSQRIISQISETDSNSLNNIEVSPNPSTDFIKIDNKNDSKINTITILDITSRNIVKQVKYNNITSTVVDINDIQKGNYIISIDTDKGTVTKKMIKK
jgi:hypothetical protein